MRRARRSLAALALLLLGFLGLLVIEALLARRGPVDPFVNPSPEPVAFGDDGPPLTFVVLGDSTGAGQGAPYADGIAVTCARHLAAGGAAGRRVTLVNLSVSGAKMADLRRDQLRPAAALRPDVVLIAAGANDVTGLTRTSRVADDLEAIVGALRERSPRVRIVVTGSPDVGSAARLAQPLRAVAGARTGQLNAAIREVAARERLTFAPIAERTGPLFKRDRSLFSADEYHPNARGYATWRAPLVEALDAAARPARD
jgi:lysophospholipase L1-like esterase